MMRFPGDTAATLTGSTQPAAPTWPRRRLPCGGLCRLSRSAPTPAGSRRGRGARGWPGDGGRAGEGREEIRTDKIGRVSVQDAEPGQVDALSLQQPVHLPSVLSVRETDRCQ